MIRTAAALFAKKTAIVAISGVVVIGGAGLALAESGDDADEQPPACVPADGVTCPDDSTTDDSTPDAGTTDDSTPDAGTTDDSTPDAGTTDDSTPDAGTADDSTTDLQDPAECDPALATGGSCPDDGDDPGSDDEPVAEHPENHGKIVSAAAHGEEGSGCEGRTGREKGQCVSAIARGEEPPAPAETPAEEQPATPGDEEQAGHGAAEELEVSEAPAPKVTGKPTHAGGKGGGRK